MAVSISVSVDDREVRELFRRAGSRDLSRPMGELGLFMVREAGRRLRRRKSDDMTGALRASLTFRARADQVTTGSNLIHAAVQQLGGEIKPRPPLKRIAIPLQAHLRRRKIWPRDLPDGTLRPVKGKGGSIVLLGPKMGSAAGSPRSTPRAGNKASSLGAEQMEPWFVLVRRAKIKARPYIVFDAAASAFLKRRLGKHLGLTT